MRTLAIIALLSLPFAAQAHDGHHRPPVPPGLLWEGHGEHQDGPCSKVKLDAGQKKKIKDALFKYEDARIGLKADLEHAKLKQKQVLADAKSDLKAGQDASASIVDAKSKLTASREAFKNQIVFEILKPEQRESYHVCEMVSHHHHGKHGFRGGDKGDREERAGR